MINHEYVKRYCKDDISLIENYDIAISDTTQTWVCHHRLEIQNGISISIKELKEKGLYFHRPANELIFMTEHEHKILHGKNIREETRIKTGLKSKESWENNNIRRKETSIRGRAMKGKIIKTPEQREKNRQAQLLYWKNHEITEEERIKRSNASKGHHVSRESRLIISQKNSGKKRTEETKALLRKINGLKTLGKHWYNNGVYNIMAFECPEGFISGRLKK